MPVIIVMDLIIILNDCLNISLTSSSDHCIYCGCLRGGIHCFALMSSFGPEFSCYSVLHETWKRGVKGHRGSLLCWLFFFLVEIEDPWRRSRAREHRLCGLRVRRRFVYLKLRFQPTVSPPPPPASPNPCLPLLPTRVKVFCTKKKQNEKLCLASGTQAWCYSCL